MKNVNFKASLFISGLFYIIMSGFFLVACSHDEPKDEGDRVIMNSIPPDIYEFEEPLFIITSDSQTIETSAKAHTPYSLPEQWEKLYCEVRMYDKCPVLPGSTHIYKPDNSANMVACGGSEYKELVGMGQYRNEEGQLIIKVTLPENDSEEYRLYTVYAIEGEFYGVLKIVQTPPRSTETKSMNIRVDGKIYSSTYEVNKDGNYIFADSEFKKILDYCENNENFVMVILQSGIVDYIDPKREDIDEYLNTLMTSTRGEITRTSYAGAFQYMDSSDIAYFGLFCENSYQGDHISYNLEHMMNSYNIPDLTDWKRNDKITSLGVAYNYQDPKYCAILTIWEDPNFNFADEYRSKHRLSIIASYWNSQVAIPDLKNIKCVGSSDNWDECISSLSGRIGYWGRSMLDY